MKVLHLSANSFTIRNLLLPQINYLTRQNLLVESACSPGADTDRMRREGYRLHPIKISRRFSLVSNLIDIYRLIKLMRRHHYDAVHVHTPFAAVLGRIAAKLAGVKHIIYTAHGFPFHDQSSPHQYRFYFLIEKLTAHLTDLVLTQSHEDFVTARKRGLCAPSKLRFLSNGIDVDRFNRCRLDPVAQAELRKSIGIPDRADLIVGVIGRLTYKKGIGFLIESIAQLLPEFPNLHAVIIGGQVVGDPNPFQTQLLARIRELGLEQHVTLTGYRADTPELLGLLDVFTLPTFTHEGLPRSILEAMAMALPVVTTDIRGCREAVTDGVNGLIVPPRDRDRLTGALRTLLDDASLRVRYGAAGRRRVEADYDERFVFRRLKACYEELGINAEADRDG
jgi:glycosyltransferase involved in cell wall biosynthesis